MIGITNSLFSVVSLFRGLSTITRPMTSFRALVIAGLLISACAVSCAMAVEHPGSLEKDADCTSCHANKVNARFVHSAMESPCGACHVTSTQGDMTLVRLSMPKDKICYACHEAASASRLHTPSVKGQCMECHDAHSSNYRMLLRKDE